MAAIRSRLSDASVRFMQEAKRRATAMMQKAARDFDRAMVGRLSGPTGAESLSVRSGLLRKSLRVQTTAQANTITLRAAIGGSGAPYAGIHETGGTIRPRQAKNLAIPVGSAKTKAGVGRFGGGPRSIWGALRLVVNKRTGKKLLVRAGKTTGGKLDVMFVLVPSVTLPARLGFRKTFARILQGTRNELRAMFREIAARGGR